MYNKPSTLVYILILISVITVLKNFRQVEIEKIEPVNRIDIIFKN